MSSNPRLVTAQANQRQVTSPLSITPKPSSDAAEPGVGREWVIRVAVAGVVRTAVVAGLTVLVISTWAAREFMRQRAALASAPDGSGPRAVVSLGRIEPEDGVITLSARSLMGQPSLVAELRVKEGDLVRSGEVVAVLDSTKQLEGAWREADGKVVLARSQLEQVQAGAKTGDLAAQEAEIARLKAELAHAEVEHQRNQMLYQQQVLSTSAYDLSRMRVENSRQLLNAATQRLRALAEVRETDLRVARANLLTAELESRRAKAEYEASIIRSPVTGRVVKIHAWPGEEVGAHGLMELAKTEHMYAIAEVLESDLPRIAVGEKATITGDALPGPLAGVVEQIGLRVARSEIINTDPAAFADTRVVEVKVRVLDPKRAENLVHSEVRVSFHP